MSKRLKHAAYLAAVLCLAAVGLAACGGGGDTTGGEDTAANASELSGTVEVWDLAAGSFPTYDPVNERLKAEFEQKYPNVTVKIVPKPFEAFEPLYRAAFAAKEVPDVMMQGSGFSGVLNFSQGLEVLNDRISPEMQEQITNWGTATPGFTEEGDHYGVPVGAAGEIFYYNKALFAKAGLPREFDPKTWDEVREAGEALKAAGIQPFTGGNKDGLENAWWFSAGWQTENTKEQAIELSNGEMPFTDQAVADAFAPEFMMQEAGLYPDDRFVTTLFPDGYGPFISGEAGMFLGLQSLAAYFGEFNPELGEKNVGMFRPPGSSYMATGAEWVWSLPKDAKNKDAAWAYIEFMGSREGIGGFVDEGVLLPNRNDVELPADAPQQAKQLVEWRRELGAFPSVVAMFPYTVTNNNILPEISQVLQGRTSMEDVQQAMQETYEKTAG